MPRIDEGHAGALESVDQPREEAMLAIDAKNLPVRVSEDFRDHYVDGPMTCADVGGTLVLTFGNVRPIISPAIGGASETIKHEVIAVCRLTMPEHIAKRLADVLARHLAAMTAQSGRA